MTPDGATASTIPPTRWLIAALIVSHGEIKMFAFFPRLSRCFVMSPPINPINKTPRWAVLQQTRWYIFFFFFEIVNCAEHLKDLVSSDSWWVPEIGESYGFTLLVHPFISWETQKTYESCGLSGPWILTWVGISIMAAIFAAVWLNVGTSRLDPRCVCVDWLLPHTRWRASSSPTQRTVAYMKKISGKCFTKPAGEQPRNHNDAISFPIWMFQKKIGQLSNWKLTCLSLPTIRMNEGDFLIKKMLAA